MRLSVSCAGCRQAKVRCVHESRPPCQRCRRTNKSGCVLTELRASKPKTGKRSHLSRTSRKQKATSASSPAIGSEQIPHQHQVTPQIAFASHDLSNNPVSALSPATVINAVETYRKRFPATNFLHYPSLILDIVDSPQSVDPVFVASLLSLCVRFMSSHELDHEKVYADYARKTLAYRVHESPSLYLAQSLVMISFYEWGSGRPYQAWMYSGMATYMIQSLLKMADDSMEHNPRDFHRSQTQYEQLIRTYWCCFAQDCELSSGARQHFALPFSQISVPLPISDRDFIFNLSPTRRLMPVDMSQKSPLAMNLTIEHGLTIVTRGFDIFIRILRFANEHRRALASLSSDGSVGSTLHLTWQRLKEELDDWRSLQDTTVKYPTTSALAHVALGYGELFAYINLIYFMSVLFLHRDRFLSNLEPHSDLFHDTRDLPLGEPQTIILLFEAAQHIGAVLSALEASEAPVVTPYSGFRVFVAAHINMYGTIAPHRYPGGSARAEEDKNKNLQYLERLSRSWPVGQSWWNTAQEANRFYEAVKSNHTHPEPGMHSPQRRALAGPLDEYGDIRSRPHQDTQPSGGSTAISHDSGYPRYSHRRKSSPPELASEDQYLSQEHATLGSNQDVETDMFQWPFIDASWSAGFDTGLETLRNNSGLFDLNPYLT